jgi:hypothetical protein
VRTRALTAGIQRGLPIACRVSLRDTRARCAAPNRFRFGLPSAFGEPQAEQPGSQFDYFAIAWQIASRLACGEAPSVRPRRSAERGTVERNPVDGRLAWETRPAGVGRWLHFRVN